LTEALAVARRIGYATLTWQAAHALGRALAATPGRLPDGRDRRAEALAMLQLAERTIHAVAERVPEAALRDSLHAWPRVRAVQEDLARLGRG
jgi:hypothetical protein